MKVKHLGWWLVQIVVTLVVSFIVGMWLGFPMKITLPLVIVVVFGLCVRDILRNHLVKPKQEIQHISCPGTYLVVSGQVDTISPEAGNGKEHRVNLVLVIRPIKNGSSQYESVILPKETLNQGSLTGVSRAIKDNHPPFRYEIRPDGSSYLFQELSQDGHKTYELTFNP